MQNCRNGDPFQRWIMEKDDPLSSCETGCAQEIGDGCLSCRHPSILPNPHAVGSLSAAVVRAPSRPTPDQRFGLLGFTGAMGELLVSWQ